MPPVHQVWPKPSRKTQWKGEEDKADRSRGGKTTSGNGQAWSSPSPRGQWRTFLRVVKSFVVPQRPLQLRDRWWQRWMQFWCSCFIVPGVLQSNSFVVILNCVWNWKPRLACSSVRHSSLKICGSWTCWSKGKWLNRQTDKQRLPSQVTCILKNLNVKELKTLPMGMNPRTTHHQLPSRGEA